MVYNTTYIPLSDSLRLSQDEYSVSVNPEDVNYANFGVNKLRIFAENSMDFFEKEKENEFEEEVRPSTNTIFSQG